MEYEILKAARLWFDKWDHDNLGTYLGVRHQEKGRLVTEHLIIVYQIKADDTVREVHCDVNEALEITALVSPAI